MGIQEPPLRPAARRSGITLAWWIALGALVIAVWMWVDQRGESERGEADEPPIASEPVAVETVAERAGPNQAQQLADLQSRLGQAQRGLEAQRLEIEGLEIKLANAEADSEAHRRGLEQAVAELNRLSDELQRLETEIRSQPPRSLPPVPTARVRPLGAPYVTTHLSGYVVASGMVTNPTDFPARGTLEVSLVGSAGVIDTRGFPMTVQPGSTERYDITFTNIFPTERLGAQARWVE